MLGWINLIECWWKWKDEFIGIRKLGIIRKGDAGTKFWNIKWQIADGGYTARILKRKKLIRIKK